MHSIRKKRLSLVFLLILGVSTAISIILYALGNNLNHFYSPSQILSGLAPIDTTFRAGGIIVPNSVLKQKDLTVIFKVTDGTSEIEMQYKGILPDLFREGQSVIATGSIDKNYKFYATQIMAKHDENYMPPEVQEALLKSAPHHIQEPYKRK